ncbi:hypothetical protein HYX04_02620 [Candidatus Woesearchaeota archaeon]|nr:hypothetical protein [Candidatus Woesearchaeota archaeon]
MGNKASIIATSLTKFGELWEKGINDLISEAGKKALDDAGISPSQIDSLYIANEFASPVSGQSLLSSIAFEELGIDGAVCVNAGDASGSVAVNLANNSLLSGQSEIAMVIGAEKTSDIKSAEMLALASSLIDQKEEANAGATIQSQLALITKKYLNDFGLDADELHFIPSNNHKNALSNEFAQYRFELSEDKIGSSQIFADPIRLLELASYCDGAAALVMCSAKISKKFDGRIRLSSSAVASDSLALSKRRSITSLQSTEKAAELAFKHAGIQNKDIGVMELYDLAPITEVLAIEGLGFAKKGEGINFIKKNIEKINTNGGLKACGNPSGATGVRQAISLIDKLRKNELKYGLSHTLAGTGALSAVNIFSFDQNA